jgi:CubicO group peptidase (beta-lactamase class C family)
MTTVLDIPVHGTVVPGYESVREAFKANFERPEPDSEVGAALCVYVGGRQVVDLWGGYADAAKTRPWQSDTLANIWSATKGIVAIAVAILVDQEKLSYDEPVAKYWPEFAQGGKERITVAQLMSHQSGLNGFSEPTTIEDFYKWTPVVERLAAQKPFWEPGTVASYHAMTYGFLAGELIHRVSGKDPGSFVRDAITRPLKADLFIGLPEDQEPRVAEMIPFDAPAGPPPAELPGRAVTNPKMDPLYPNTRAWRAAQIPAGNGQATARGLGRIYGAIANGGELDGVRIISSQGIDRMRRIQHRGPDQLLGERYWGAGVWLNAGAAFGPYPETFGHAGWGGAFGCANREHLVGTGYIMNRMGAQLVGNPRGVSLSEAIFNSAP